MYRITRTDEEISDLLNRAADEFDLTMNASADAIIATVNWLTGASDQDPMS